MGCVGGYLPPPLVTSPNTTLPIISDSIQYFLFPDTQLSSILSNVTTNIDTTVQTTDALDPVDLATGDFTYNNTLLHLGGDTLDYDFTLQYRSRSIYD